MSIHDQVIIATNTLYDFTRENDRVRVELSKQTVKKAKELGFEILVVDVGSPTSLLEEYRKLGARVIVSGGKGMGKGRRITFQKAYEEGRKVVVWMEPEKVDFLRSIEVLAKPILNGEADIVIPKRRSLASYPLSQQYNEPFINGYIKELTGLEADIVFGPRLINRDSLHYFINYDGRYGDKWDAIFVPIFAAMKDGKKVKSIEIEYTHPKEQTEIEEKEALAFYRKRLEQVNNVLGAVEKFWEGTL